MTFVDERDEVFFNYDIAPAWFLFSTVLYYIVFTGRVLFVSVFHPVITAVFFVRSLFVGSICFTAGFPGTRTRDIKSNCY